MEIFFYSVTVAREDSAPGYGQYEGYTDEAPPFRMLRAYIVYLQKVVKNIPVIG